MAKHIYELTVTLFSIQLLVLKYVQNKDVFMRYHKAHLTRRLILDISADSEIEENMVEWLRVSNFLLIFILNIAHGSCVWLSDAFWCAIFNVKEIGNIL